MTQLATRPQEPAWDRIWAAAYEDGHNNRGLRGKRLAQFAHAYADIAEETAVLLPFDVFFERWEKGAYFGTSDENWHVATVRYIAPR